MARGDCERAFQSAAHADGIDLERARVPWINQRGHLGLSEEAAAAREVLARIFVALGGDVEQQAAKAQRALPGGFAHSGSQVFVEVDEHQHFTSWRLRTLELYPRGVDLGFDLDTYVGLCRSWSERSDRYRASKAAIAFGEGGRQRQRAYYDALRDLVTPVVAGTPLLRAAAPDRDGARAYAEVRDRLHDVIRSAEHDGPLLPRWVGRWWS